MKSMIEKRQRSMREESVNSDLLTWDERERIERRIQDKIDRALEDSFPASDPPGWTLGIERVR